MVVIVALLVEWNTIINNGGRRRSDLLLLLYYICYYQLIIDDDDDTLIGGEDVWMQVDTCGGRLAKGVSLSEEEDTRASVNTGCPRKKREALHRRPKPRQLPPSGQGSRRRST